MTILILADREPYISYSSQVTNDVPEGPGGPSVVVCDSLPRAGPSMDVLVAPAYMFLEMPQLQKIGTSVIVYGDVTAMEAAFDRGCVDFLREPWSMRELFARAGRLERPRICIDGVEFVLDRDRLRQGDRSVSLTESERRLTALFFRNHGLPLTRDAIMYALCGEFNAQSRSIDNHISSLRRKLNQLSAGAGRRIKAVRSLGYRLT